MNALRTDTLALFGAYCIGLGWLTLKSAFIPGVIGALLIVAGLGWLTYLHPPLAKQLGVWAIAPGMIGEGMLTLWLLAAGVDPSAGGRRRRGTNSEGPEHTCCPGRPASRG